MTWLADGRTVGRAVLVSSRRGLRLFVRRRPGRVPVDRTSEVVIDGFPRCGNTFAVIAFDLAQGRGRDQGDITELGHHTHAAGQIKASVRYGVPTVLLIRQPRDAITSHAAYYPDVSTIAALAAYIVFYGSCRSLRDRVVVADFAAVTTDFGGVIERVNQRWGTGFAVFRPTAENTERCFALIERGVRGVVPSKDYDRVVPSPNAARAADRAARDAAYGAAPAWLRLCAERIYASYVGSQP